MSAIAQYLQRYAEPEAKLTQGLKEQFDSVVVLPCFDESWADCGLLLQNRFERKVLIILVLNQPDDLESCKNNEEVHDSLSIEFRKFWHSSDQRLALFAKNDQSVMLVDRFSKHHRISRKHGVGLARKIGADIALSLIQHGNVRTPWIHNIDADVVLPKSYVALCDKAASSTAAIILPFVHTPSENLLLNQAQAIYDQHMNYYVAALKWANSPYAYHSLGSTLIINVQHYAQVRGFPKRSAGEDFHLLNKLCKVGSIESIPAPPIKIRTRTSHRTPFGTGAAISDILTLGCPEREFLFYDPAVFEELKTLLSVFPELRNDHKKALSSLNSEVQTVLHAFDINKAIQHAAQHSNTKPGFLKHMHTWFDALKTLQFIHALRDSKYPSVAAQNLDPLLPDKLQF
ncbi:MAG: hypothetical protein AAF542_00705 [Pseudomonadota bacterium]